MKTNYIMLSCRIPKALADELNKIRDTYGTRKQFIVQSALQQYVNGVKEQNETKGTSY